jgi:hypothetical protein
MIDASNHINSGGPMFFIPEEADRTECKSISFKSWFLTIIDRAGEEFGENRSSMAFNGMKKHLIFKLRAGRIYEIIRELYHVPLDLDDREEITVSLPKDIANLFRNHTKDCAYNIDDMFLIALSKFMLCKDNPRGLWEMIYSKAVKANNFFHTIIG